MLYSYILLLRCTCNSRLVMYIMQQDDIISITDLYIIIIDLCQTQNPISLVMFIDYILTVVRLDLWIWILTEKIHRCGQHAYLIAKAIDINIKISRAIGIKQWLDVRSLLWCKHTDSNQITTKLSQAKCKLLQSHFINNVYYVSINLSLAHNATLSMINKIQR